MNQAQLSGMIRRAASLPQPSDESRAQHAQKQGELMLKLIGRCLVDIAGDVDANGDRFYLFCFCARKEPRDGELAIVQVVIDEQRQQHVRFVEATYDKGVYLLPDNRNLAAVVRDGQFDL